MSSTTTCASERRHIVRVRPEVVRNVLVHDYATVDVHRVHAGLARLDDFEAFVADVESWLARSGR